jgi:hypothetical protein
MVELFHACSSCRIFSRTCLSFLTPRFSSDLTAFNFLPTVFAASCKLKPSWKRRIMLAFAHRSNRYEWPMKVHPVIFDFRLVRLRNYHFAQVHSHQVGWFGSLHAHDPQLSDRRLDRDMPQVRFRPSARCQLFQHCGEYVSNNLVGLSRIPA